MVAKKHGKSLKAIVKSNRDWIVRIVRDNYDYTESYHTFEIHITKLIEVL